MNGRSARAKGHAWERAVAHELERATGVACKRSLEEVRGVSLGRDVQTELPLSVQCKHGRRFDYIGALEEAERAATGGQKSMAFIRRNGSGKRPADEVVLVRASTALEWIAKLHKNGLL